MDRVEYQEKMQEIRKLADEKNYSAAADIIAQINWRRVRSASSLCFVGTVLDKAKRYEQGKELLLMAYDRSPIGRTIIYALAELCIHQENYNEAEEYYKEFVEVAPRDSKRYELRYRLDRIKGASADELIRTLEQLKERDFTEKWTYELAQMYHKAGRVEKCVALCDEIVLWFGDGDYVEKALELKMLYEPLTNQQRRKYEEIKMRKEGYVKVSPEDVHMSGEILHNEVKIPTVDMDMNRFNTTNLQQEIAKGMEQIIAATEKETVTSTMDNIRKMVEESQLPIIDEEEDTSHLYENIETDEEIDGALNINFQELLAEENDGQMSMVVPDNPMIERQITGQMSIEDILAEWERTKHAAETAMEEAKQKRLESAKQRALAETGNLMDKLAEVQAIVAEMEAMSQGQAMGSVVEDVADIMDNTMELKGAIENTIPRYVNPSEMSLEEIVAQPTAELPNIDFNVPKVEEPEITFEEVESPIEEPESDEEAEIEEEAEALVEDAMTDIGEEIDEEVNSAELEGEDEIGYEEDNENYIGEAEAYEESVDAAEEEAKEESKAEAERIEKEEPIPVVNLEQPKKKANKWDTLSLEFLTKEEKAIFSYFIPVNGMEKQICAVLQGVKSRKLDGTSSAGNVLITGGIRSGKTVLATDIIKVLQTNEPANAKKVGRISGDKLNEKDVEKIVEQISNGYLIIERAGKITTQTASRLSAAMSGDTENLVVFLEDTGKGVEELMERAPKLMAKFTEHISIPVFTNDELVAFGKSYAKEVGYSLDEMAVLALYKSIGHIRKFNEATTLTEIKEIIDNAIVNAEKPRFGKIFHKKGGEGDTALLREKDFEE